jgi:hypothetical protein
VEASFDFRAAFNATAGRMMTVVLRNQRNRCLDPTLRLRPLIVPFTPVM